MPIEYVCVREATSTKPDITMDIESPSFRQDSFERSNNCWSADP